MPKQRWQLIISAIAIAFLAVQGLCWLNGPVTFKFTGIKAWLEGTEAPSGEDLRGGTLVVLEDGRHRWEFAHGNTELTRRLFKQEGLLGGGPTWLSVAEGLVANSAPELAASIKMEAESEVLTVWCDGRDPIAQLALLIEQATADEDLLIQAIEHARSTGTLE